MEDQSCTLAWKIQVKACLCLVTVSFFLGDSQAVLSRFNAPSHQQLFAT